MGALLHSCVKMCKVIKLLFEMLTGWAQSLVYYMEVHIPQGEGEVFCVFDIIIFIPVGLSGRWAGTVLSTSLPVATGRAQATVGRPAR